MFAVLRFNLSKLFTVSQDQIHVFVKGFKSANENPTILQNDSHSVVDMLEHLIILADRHFGTMY